LQYQAYSCEQLAGELERTSRRVGELRQSVDARAENDSAVTAAGLILFWPALFFIKGNSPDAQEYGRLKGEFEAAEKTAIFKNCNIAVRRIEPEPAKDSATTTATPASLSR